MKVDVQQRPLVHSAQSLYTIALIRVNPLTKWALVRTLDQTHLQTVLEPDKACSPLTEAARFLGEIFQGQDVASLHSHR